MKPKILIISLVVAFILALCAVGAMAADEVKTSGNGLFQYTVHDGNKATITKYLGEETTVTVNKIDGRYTVDSIGYAAFAENTKIQSVNIYASVTSIGESAFEACTSLKTVTFRTGSALSEIGEYAFYDCTELSGFEFPEKLVSIGYGAFRNCSKLTYDLSTAASLEAIGEYAFSSCGNSASSFDVTIPSKVKTVGYGAFYGCSAVSGFAVAPGNGAFSASDGVLMNHDGSEIIIYPMSKTAKDFSVPSGVKKIGDGAFAGVTSLETLDIPDGVTEIGGGAFYNAAALKK
ncbi:MAG: leucine-rich repeat protein, partial [Clostridia bacterium]|nr:leucine-rich repeat protein [Clostridia bacterium]